MRIWIPAAILAVSQSSHFAELRRMPRFTTISHPRKKAAEQREDDIEDSDDTKGVVVMSYHHQNSNLGTKSYK